MEVFFDFLTQKKDAFDSLESIATIAGIIVAGIWAYMLFVRKREKYPRADMKQRIEFWDVSDNERLVRVVLVMENKSDVLLRILNGFTWVQQMRPWPSEAMEKFKEGSGNLDVTPTEIGWPLIAEKLHKNEREVEPKELDEVSMDFVIDKGYQQILVYSFLENSEKPGRNLGWITSTVIDFTKDDGTVLQQGQGQAIQKPRPKNAKAHPEIQSRE